MELFRCEGDVCSEFGAYGRPDTQGRFTFDKSSVFRILESGTYRIVATAWDYQPNETDPFDVPPGAKIDVGTIALEPPVISLLDATPCADLPAAGRNASMMTRFGDLGM